MQARERCGRRHILDLDRREKVDAATRLLDQARETLRLRSRARDENLPAVQTDQRPRIGVRALAAQVLRNLVAQRFRVRRLALELAADHALAVGRRHQCAQSHPVARAVFCNFCKSGKRQRATAAEHAAHGTLGAYAGRGRCIGKRCEQRNHFSARGETFDAQRALPRCRQHLLGLEPRRDARMEPQPRQAGGGEHDGVVLPPVELRQARVDVAAQQAHLQAGMALDDLRLAPQARGSDGGAIGHLRQGCCSWQIPKHPVDLRVAVIAASMKPGGSSAGTSFIECTARSARPSAIAFSSSLTNRPLPPAWSSRRSMSSSPRVDIGRSSTRSAACALCSRSAMCCACHRASRLRRVAMTSFFMSPVHAPPAIAAGSPAGVLPAHRAPPASGPRRRHSARARSRGSRRAPPGSCGGCE